MKRLWHSLAVLCLILTACSVPRTAREPIKDCSSELAQQLDECKGTASSTPEETPTPSPVPATPTPEAIQPEEYQNLMGELKEYEVSIEGLSSEPNVYSGALKPFVNVSAKVVNLTVNKFAPGKHPKPLVIVLKMEDEAYEHSQSYVCTNLMAAEIAPLLSKSVPYALLDGEWIKDLFYPGSKDKYVFICGGPNDKIHNYKGWALFLTIDPNQDASLEVDPCAGIQNCSPRNQTALPQATQVISP